MMDMLTAILVSRNEEKVKISQGIQELRESVSENGSFREKSKF
jgi:hypothetical protein